MKERTLLERWEGRYGKERGINQSSVSPDLILLDLGVNAVKGVFFTSKEIAGFLSKEASYSSKASTR